MIELLAQERVHKILTGVAATKRLAQSYLFVGPERSGKTTAAKLLYELICGNVPKLGEPDFYELIPEGNSIKINQVRAVKQHVAYGPHSHPYCLVVVQHAEKMTTDAANSFLKLLEEPPPGVVFILETTQVERILATIRSRSQLIVFDVLPVAIVAKLLNIEPEAARIAAKFSGGSMKLAEVYLAQRDELESFLTMVRTIQTVSLTECLLFSERLAKTPKETLLQYLYCALYQCRDNQAIAKAKILLEYIRQFNANVNLRLTLDVLFLKLREAV